MATERRQLVRVRDAAALLGVSTKTVRRWIRFRKVQALRLPSATGKRGSVRIDQRELDRLLSRAEASGRRV